MLQQIISNLFGSRGNPAAPQGNQLVGYPTFLTIGDGDAAYNTSAEVAALVEANTGTARFAKIWEMSMPAQQMAHWGHGNPNQQRNQGYLTFAALDVATGFEDGTLRLVQANARETKTLVVLEIATQRLHTGDATSVATAIPRDINQMVPIPEQLNTPFVGEDSKLQLWFRTTNPTTTVDAVDFTIPATLYQ